MKHRVLSILFAVGLLAPCFASSETVQSFREWKTEKIQSANRQLQVTRAAVQNLRLKLTAQDQSKNMGLKALESQANQLEWNLEIAQELSVSDYLMLYLSGRKESSRYHKAASHLNTQEIAEVLEAYVKVVDARDTDNLKKLPVQAIQAK